MYMLALMRVDDIGDMCVNLDCILTLLDLYLYRSAAEREEHKLSKLYMVLEVFITIILNMTLIWKM